MLAEQNYFREVSLCNLPNPQHPCQIIIDKNRFRYYVIGENRFVFEFEEKVHDD